MIGVTLLVVVVLAIAIWVVLEMQRLRHKSYAIALIFILLVLYFTVSYSLKGQDVDLTTVSGFVTGAEIYFNFIVSSLGNLKTLTSHAVELDWNGNETEG
jgi:CDP-diglyceride synthetase